MRVISRGGPHDEHRWNYPDPVPRSLMLLDRATLAYHEYVRQGRTNVYRHVGFVGRLPITQNLDEPDERTSL